jgi:hypothetical protein
MVVLYQQITNQLFFYLFVFADIGYVSTQAFKIVECFERL